MLVQLSAAAGLIAATVAIQAIFLSTGLRAFFWTERHRPKLMVGWPMLTTVICILYLMADHHRRDPLGSFLVRHGGACDLRGCAVLLGRHLHDGRIWRHRFRRRVAPARDL
jgi:hypothetical protein